MPSQEVIDGLWIFFSITVVVVGTISLAVWASFRKWGE